MARKYAPLSPPVIERLINVAYNTRLASVLYRKDDIQHSMNENNSLIVTQRTHIHTIKIGHIWYHGKERMKRRKSTYITGLSHITTRYSSGIEKTVLHRDCDESAVAFRPIPFLFLPRTTARSNRHRRNSIPNRAGKRDKRESGREWGRICGALFIINDIHALVNSRDFHSVR